MSSDGHDTDDEDDTSFTREPQSRHDGEDLSLVTKRELNGWYAYPIAAEVFAVVGVGMSILVSKFPQLDLLYL